MSTIVEWYEQISKDESFNDIQTLMKKRGQLAAASVNLAKQIKDKHSWLRRESFYAGISKKRLVIELQTKTDPNTNKAYTSAKANAMADTEWADFEAPLEVTEVEIDGDKLVLKQINQVLEAMRQDIAEMRAEREGK